MTVPSQQMLQPSPLSRQLERMFQDHLRSLIPPFKAPTDRGWLKRAQSLRRRALQQIYLRGYDRSVLEGKPKVVWGDVLRPHPDYLIRKFRFQIVPDYWVPSLLYEPTHLSGKAPVVLNPNGHHRGGKAADYKQARCINLAKRGMIALNLEYLGMSELEADSQHFMAALNDLTGQVGVGMFYLAMKRALDILLDHPHADNRRVAMTGLSGGGWQTIVLAALDPRVTVVVPVAGYTAVRARIGRRGDIGDLEQCPADLTTVLDYSDMTAMLAPRPTLQITNQTDDCCFATPNAKPVIYDAIVPTYRAMNALDRFQWHSNRDPGTHNYGPDNRSQLYRFLNRHFGLQTPEHDLPYEQELIPEWDLFVCLPQSQATMQELARRRAVKLSHSHQPPRTAAQRAALRRKLAAVIRLPQFQPRATKLGSSARGANWLLRQGKLALPIHAHVRRRSPRVEVFSVDNDCHNWLSRYEPDPAITRFTAHLLGQGQNSVDYQHMMMLETCGQRILGLRVAQLLAATRFALSQSGHDKADLVTYGLGAGMAALIAAALHPELFHSASVSQVPPTMLRFFDLGYNYQTLQPAMCLGLLEVADVQTIAALLDGVELRQPTRSTPPRRS